MAANSAHVKPPVNARRPPTTQASIRRRGEGIRAAMIPVVKNTAEPMTLPITRDVAPGKPIARFSRSGPSETKFRLRNHAFILYSNQSREWPVQISAQGYFRRTKVKQGLSILIAGLLITATAYTQTAPEPKTGQDSKADKPATTTTGNAEDAQRVATGEITKIDVKKKILTVREAPINPPATSGQNTNVNRRGNGGVGGGGMGGGRRRGGTGYPGSRPSTTKPQGKEFKVTITDQTAIKDNVTSIGFDLLRVGDRIAIQGLPKGKGSDLQATQITVSQ